MRSVSFCLSLPFPKTHKENEAKNYARYSFSKGTQRARKENRCKKLSIFSSLKEGLIQVYLNYFIVGLNEPFRCNNCLDVFMLIKQTSLKLRLGNQVFVIFAFQEEGTNSLFKYSLDLCLKRD